MRGLATLLCFFASMCLPACSRGSDSPAAPTGTAGAPQPAAPAPDRFGRGGRLENPTILARGADLVTKTAGVLIFRDAEAWARFWNDGHAGEVPPPAVPPNDFEKDWVAVILAGERPSAGFQVLPPTVTKNVKGDVVIAYSLKRPRPGKVVAAVITHPYLAFAVPHFPGDVIPEEKKEKEGAR